MGIVKEACQKKQQKNVKDPRPCRRCDGFGPKKISDSYWLVHRIAQTYIAVPDDALISPFEMVCKSGHKSEW